MLVSAGTRRGIFGGFALSGLLSGLIGSLINNLGGGFEGGSGRVGAGDVGYALRSTEGSQGGRGAGLLGANGRGRGRCGWGVAVVFHFIFTIGGQLDSGFAMSS